MQDRNTLPSRHERNLSVHLVDGGALLFEAGRQSLFSTNASAAAIWCELEEQQPPALVARRLADRFGLDLATARTYVADTLRQWRQAHRPNGEAVPAGTFGHASPVGDPGPVGQLLARAEWPAAVVEQYRLLDSVVSIRFETPTLAQRVNEVLGHLAHDDTSMPATLTFDVGHLESGFAFLEHDEIYEYCRDPSQAVAMVRACLIDRTLEDCADFAAIHAAAVRRGDRCILFPGMSGAGKSVLAAGLAAEGYTLFGDDTVTLRRGDFAVRPIPCGVCVKQAGWDVLASRFPELRVVPVHSRPDNHDVRYLMPPAIDLAGIEDAAEVGWIVFPRYAPERATDFVPLSGIEALERLLINFLPLGNRLVEEDVDALIKWVSTRPVYELRTSSLTEAVRLLNFLQ